MKQGLEKSGVQRFEGTDFPLTLATSCWNWVKPFFSSFHARQAAKPGASMCLSSVCYSCESGCHVDSGLDALTDELEMDLVSFAKECEIPQTSQK